MIWKSDGDDVRRKYDFTYDAVNRLIKRDFEQQNSNDHAWNHDQVNYSIKYRLELANVRIFIKL